MTQPEKDDLGLWVYRVLPEEAKVFSIEMYKKQDLKLNTAFIIHSFVYDEYQCFRVSKRTFEWILPFVLADRMYYFTDSADTIIIQALKITDKLNLSLKF